MNHRLIGLALVVLVAACSKVTLASDPNAGDTEQERQMRTENKKAQLKIDQMNLKDALRSKDAPEKIIKILQRIEETNPQLLTDVDMPHATILDAVESGTPIEVIKYLYEQHIVQDKPLSKDFIKNVLLPRVNKKYEKKDVQNLNLQLDIDRDSAFAALDNIEDPEVTIKILKEIEETNPTLFTQYDGAHPINYAVIKGAPLNVIKYLHKKIARNSSKGIEYQILYFAFRKHNREDLQPLIDYLKSEKRTDDTEVKEIEDRVTAEKKGISYHRGK